MGKVVDAIAAFYHWDDRMGWMKPSCLMSAFFNRPTSQLESIHMWKNDPDALEGFRRAWRRIRHVPRMSLFVLLALWISSQSVSGLTSEELNTISVYEKVAPSIVNITTRVCEPEFYLCALPASGTASGIVISEGGLILTNYHVVADAENIQVAVEDGRRLKAEVAGIAPDDDLAMVRVEVGDRKLKPLSLVDAEPPVVGEKVLAIGNPFGLGRTLTTGTVSMVGRDIKNEGRIMRNLIQTDAAINPGNSGGALLNSKGQLLGVNTIILSPTGSSIGIGFAIPTSRIKKVLPGLRNPWEKRVAWVLAFAIIYWMIRRIFRWVHETNRMEN